MRSAAHSHPNYVGIWVILTVITFGELGVVFLGHWPKELVVITLVLLAAWKALLVALYFMHLRFETYRLRLLAIAPLPLTVVLISAGVFDRLH